jgi:hypothetical protein
VVVLVFMLLVIMVLLMLQDQVGEVMRKSGVSVVTTTVCNLAAFMAASLIPIPAMRSFCWTVGHIRALQIDQYFVPLQP